jgi:hypothetical protein
MPLAELVVLLTTALQLRGHGPNDRFALVCDSIRLAIRLHKQELHRIEVRLALRQQLADVLVECLGVADLLRGLKHALPGGHRLPDDLENLPGLLFWVRVPVVLANLLHASVFCFISTDCASVLGSFLM